MFVKEYLSKDYPSFSLDDQVSLALACVEDFGYSHVFIEKNDSFLGAISKEFLDHTEGNLSSLEHHLERFAIQEEHNILDSIRLFYTFNTNIVPILSKEEKYLGYLSGDDVFRNLSLYPLFSEMAAILTVEVPAKKYAMTEIANIVETNNCKFYGGFISQMNDQLIQVTIKISSEDLSSVEATFERYGYAIVEKYYANKKTDLLKDRMDFLQKYIHI